MDRGGSLMPSGFLLLDICFSLIYLSILLVLIAFLSALINLEQLMAFTLLGSLSSSFLAILLFFIDLVKEFVGKDQP